MKTGKATSTDDIPIEACKCLGEVRFGGGLLLDSSIRY